MNDDYSALIKIGICDLVPRPTGVIVNMLIACGYFGIN